MGRKQAIENPKIIHGVGNPYYIVKSGRSLLSLSMETGTSEHGLTMYGLESILSVGGEPNAWKIHVKEIRLREFQFI